MVSASKIIPPNTKVDFTLTRSRDEFYLLSQESDTEKYKVKLLNVVLYCPIGIMSDRLTQEIYAKWEHTPIKYYYTRTVVKSLTMPLSKAEFLSDNLFPESEAPVRVFVMLVESDAYLGKLSKSPFAFQRKWVVETDQLHSLQNNLQFENTYLKSTLDTMQGQMAQLIEHFITNPRKGSEEDDENDDEESEEESLASKRSKRYKNKTNMQKKTPSKVEKKLLRNNAKNNEKNQPVPGPSGLLGRIMNTLNPMTEEIQLDDVMSDRHSIAGSVLSAAPQNPLQAKVTQTYWVTNIELEMMSSPLDQLTSKGNEDEAMADYVRLQRSLNQFNQVISCGISYDHFLKSAFIAAYDLTTNQQPGLAYAINTVRTGNEIYIFFKYISIYIFCRFYSNSFIFFFSHSQISTKIIIVH